MDPVALAIPVERIHNAIVIVRGHKVMLDEDLAALYGVEVRTLNQAVKRNIERFPHDFMFQLTWDEARRSRSQSVILNEDRTEKHQNMAEESDLSRSQSVILKQGRNLKYRRYAFTEQGVAMLSSVLRSPQAVQVNIEVVRAFVRLRQLLATHADLARKLEAMESKYDAQFKVVFEAIRELMASPPEPERGRFGFHPPLPDDDTDTTSNSRKKRLRSLS